MSTSTTVLTKHMTNTHRIKIASEREELKQQKLTDVFLSKSKAAVNDHRLDDQYILARRLLLWYARDLLPFSTVENQGFNDFWRSLKNHMSLPSRSTISIAALDDMYNCMKKELLSTLSTSGGNYSSILNQI